MCVCVFVGGRVIIGSIGTKNDKGFLRLRVLAIQAGPHRVPSSPISDKSAVQKCTANLVVE